MSKKTMFNDEWKYWIWNNIKNGVNKKEIFKILIENNYDSDVICNELNYDVNKNMDFNSIIIPNGIRFNSDKALIFTIDNFMSDEECSKIIELTKSNLKPSKITGDGKDTSFRTSYSCDLYNNCSIINDIEKRISDTLNICPSYGESMQSQYYKIGNQFKLHTDYFEPFTDEYINNASINGNRTWTFMIYLNNVQEGGCTFMKELDYRVKPERGKALLWYNLKSNGDVNPHTLHAGEPIIKGEKYIITKWFRIKKYKIK